MIAGPKRLGSFTAFLLKDLRCSCAKPLLQVAGADAMATRYKPPQATWGKRQQQMQTALRTRASNTFARDAALVSLSPGTTIGGCYQLIEMVGKGGMGVVYKARHTALDRTLALKFLAPSMVSRESWQLFQQEAKLNATLSHPSLCQIYDLGIHANALPFYAMDFVSGQTLEQVILDTGPLSVGATLEIFIKVAEGLSYAHRRNVVHRDIKPANIMIANTASDTAEIKLLDFGIAELGEKQGKGEKKAEKIIGSAAYMSPEQFTGKTIDARSDIYNLGCTIFETLTGALPFEGENFDTLDRQHSTVEPPLLSDITDIAYPQELEAVIKKCLHKSRERRYQNASELTIDLQRILSHKELQFARAEQESLQQSPKPENISAPNVKILLAAMSGLVLIALLTLQIIQLTQNSLSNLPSSLAPSHQSSPDNSNNLQTSEFETKISSIRELKENEFFVSSKTSDSNIPTRVFSFPVTGIPAILVARTAQGPLAKKCTGTVEITSDNLELWTSSTYDSDEIVRGFRPQDITGLDSSRSGTAEYRLLANALKRFKLKMLRLSNAQQNLANFSLLHYLEPDSYLDLVGQPGTDNPTSQQAKLPPLSNVKTLALTDFHPPLADIVTAPAQMPFAALIISTNMLPLSEARLISQWPNLSELTISTRQTDADFLEPLLTSPRLKQLTIRGNNLNLSTLDFNKIAGGNEDLKLTLSNLKQTEPNLKVINQLKTQFPLLSVTTPSS